MQCMEDGAVDPLQDRLRMSESYVTAVKGVSSSVIHDLETLIVTGLWKISNAVNVFC